MATRRAERGRHRGGEKEISADHMPEKAAVPRTTPHRFWSSRDDEPLWSITGRKNISALPS